ncbi:hypothetical protein WME90_20565 [Sorangium sp. So ce375]|uniref:hypothetical protein n=1 Tax=Sorangium sp. So ce375 TaxID=3133306 RepID=UPI003F5C2410
MGDRWSFRRWLRALLGRAVEPSRPEPSLISHSSYRTPAPRGAPPREGSPHAAGELNTSGVPLTALMLEAYEARLTTSEPEMVRIDPPGLLDSWSVIGVSQWFWQYQRRNLILFERGESRYIYVPARQALTRAMPGGAAPPDALEGWAHERAPRAEPMKRMRLQQLHGCALDSAPGGDGWAALVQRVRGEAPPQPDDIDLAPLVRPDLCRAADAARLEPMVCAFGVLDTLAVFQGLGSHELTLPRVLFGGEAAELIEERLGGRAPGHVRDELQRGAPAARRSDGVRRLAAVVDRHHELDGYVGGHEAELALVKLELSAGGWVYEREVLWADAEEGDPMS